MSVQSRHYLALPLALALLLAARPCVASDETPAYTAKGADTCLKCHDESSDKPVVPIFKTRHANRADSRTPFAQLQCESCHGPGGDHTRKLRVGETRSPIRDFGVGAMTDAETQNGVCLGCHDGAGRIGWHGSAHESADLPCAGCHVVHAAQDPVLDVATQPEVCSSCHPREHAAGESAYVHPLRYGQMACSDCHAAHGSSGPSLLTKTSVNETCYTCHADKRGPFLWEHAPAAEDCTLCHQPHGSSQPALLTQPTPLLCQQCHSQAGHPSVPYTADGLPSGDPSGFLLGASCTNCHAQVHGSNHPSGAALLR